METINQILDLLPNQLKGFTGIEVIERDFAGKRPKCPFISYKITSPFIPDRFRPVVTTKVIESAEQQFEKDIEMTYSDNPSTVISITVHESEAGDPMMKAFEARKFFVTPQMFPRLIEALGVVKDVSTIQPRDSLLAADREKKMGFDVKIGWENITTVRERTIESVEINNKSYDL